ncbi:YceI family protein [Reichenbachiella ulvae]|uniref:YceI family protein n=1 Tax=Reichenbachiella ulvae TaxID=2980104 RepID=A0ABT3CSQ7_9BACT|nr:YceI family protein [Reichenbachiella ulvae]MCV9386539.1 YceI family protein [Reichenbachiella ulvae]
MKIASIIFALASLLAVQSTIKLDKANSTITIAGTSTVHDWESEVSIFNIEGTKSDNNITGLKVSIQVKSINSGKSLMDDKTYEALKEDKYPNIVFEAQQLSITGNKVSGSGQLTMAGKTKTVALNGKIISDANGILKVEGSNKINMKDYGIKPPTAMFGSIETGEEVTVKYNIKLNY